MAFKFGSGTTPTLYDTPRVLEAKILMRLNQLSSAGGGFGMQGNYGGAAPGTTPGGATFAVDLDTGKVWYYTNSEWVFSGTTLSL